MKILFLSIANLPDYLCDMAFHGLVSAGHEVTDANKLTFMYSSYPESAKASLYGRGYSIYGKLPDSPVNRSDINERIRSKHFDFVIYGNVRRYTERLDVVTDCYEQNSILLLDGEDDCSLKATAKGVYFKRELVYPTTERLRPISFAIPEDCIRPSSELCKIQLLATCDPRNRVSYIFPNENEYYEAYSRSYWAFTSKKDGWDCLRHYEILAAGCLPYFPGIEDCPETTMCSFPKSLTKISNELFLKASQSNAPYSSWVESYNQLLQKMMSHVREHCTTTALANQLLGAEAL
jgi:hypothetical protein